MLVVAAGLQRGDQGHITTSGTGSAPQALSAVVKNVVRWRILAENGRKRAQESRAPEKSAEEAPPPKMAQSPGRPRGRPDPTTRAHRAQGHGKEETTMNPLELLLLILGLLSAGEEPAPLGPEGDPNG